MQATPREEPEEFQGIEQDLQREDRAPFKNCKSKINLIILLLTLDAEVFALPLDRELISFLFLRLLCTVDKFFSHSEGDWTVVFEFPKSFVVFTRLKLGDYWKFILTWE